MVEKEYDIWESYEPKWIDEPYSRWRYRSKRDCCNEIKAIQGQLTILSNLCWELKQNIERLMKNMENNK